MIGPDGGWLEAKRRARRELEQVAHDFEKTNDEEIAGIIAKIAGELEK